jgi:hypothetical protein
MVPLLKLMIITISAFDYWELQIAYSSPLQFETYHNLISATKKINRKYFPRGRALNFDETVSTFRRS